MAGNLKRIEQTAQAQLDELMGLGDRFNDAYDHYLRVLAPAVQKHLILATYQICTRGYPEQFLTLSLDERVSVQSQLQQLAKQIRLGFEGYFESEEPDAGGSESGEEEPSTVLIDRDGDGSLEPDQPVETPGETPGENDSESHPESGSSAAARSPRTNPEAATRSTEPNPSNLADVSTWHLEDLTSAKLKQFLHDRHNSESKDTGSPSSPASQDAETLPSGATSGTSDGAETEAAKASGSDRPNLTEQEAHLIALALKAKLQAEANQSYDQDDDGDDVTTPNSLRSWQRSVESDIARMLHQASVQANQLLHQSGILPQEFPLGLLEALGQGEAIAEIPNGTPNLLKLTLKGGSHDTPEPHSGTLHLMAIHLHLAEIEFAEAAVSQARHVIRQLLAELSGLRKRYAANQKEYTIAKAEAAWRSTWSQE